MLVAALGDAATPLTWSGIPYHLTEAGRDVGFVRGGLSLIASGRDWAARRAAWNVMQLLRGDRRGGYQYSRTALEHLWRPVKKSLAGTTVLNCFPLYAPSVVADPAVERWFFNDLSLTLLFDYYRVRPTVGERIAADAVAREKEGYAAARGIVAMSHFAAAHLREVYGVPADRVHVVVPGANLKPAAYARWEEAEARAREAPVKPGPLRLVMVSTDWRRKGLDRLLRALALGRRQGLQATLRVVGNVRADLPPELTELPGVEWLGRIKKDSSAEQFLSAVADADVGCIFARYEAGGSVLREYHALGLAAFATDAGGMPDWMFQDAAVTVPPEASDEEIAEKLVALDRDRARLAALRAVAWRRRHEAMWGASVARLREVIIPAG